MNISEFDFYNLDYLCYSFFNARKLNYENITPIIDVQTPNLSIYTITKSNKIFLQNTLGDGNSLFSLASVVSKSYFKKIIKSDYATVKIHNKYLLMILSLLLSYPNYLILLKIINNLLNRIKIKLCLYPVDTPFNLEKTLIDYHEERDSNICCGVLKKEIFANFDDDNGAYGESLLKRGFSFIPDEKIKTIADDLVQLQSNLIDLDVEQQFELTYFPRVGRIYSQPLVKVEVLSGAVNIKLIDDDIYLHTLHSGQFVNLYSNKHYTILSIKKSFLKLTFSP